MLIILLSPPVIGFRFHDSDQVQKKILLGSFQCNQNIPGGSLISLSTLDFCA